MLDGIRDLGNDVYLVNGRVIRIMHNSIDVGTEEGQQALIDRAAKMFTGKFTPRLYGALTYQEVYPKIDTPRGLRHSVDYKHFGILPESVKAVLREEFPQYADQI